MSVTKKELEESNAELRGALIFAAKRIIKLSPFQRRTDPALVIFRRVLRDARIVAKVPKKTHDDSKLIYSPSPCARS